MSVPDAPSNTAPAAPAPPPVIRLPYGYRLCPRCKGRSATASGGHCTICNDRSGIVHVSHVAA